MQHVARELGLYDQGTVHIVPQEEGYILVITLLSVQELLAEDSDQRMKFSKWISHHLENDFNFISHIL